MNRVLVSPLDWGLGHATRLSRLIDELLLDNEVVIAASGRGYFFLKQRYPNIKVIRIPSLPLAYARRQRFFYLSIIGIVLKLFVNCLVDRLFLWKILRRYDIDLIISDNRFCFHSTNVKSWYITHQLHIIVPKNLSFTDKLVQKINLKFIRKYDLVLVPDFENKDLNLTGILSHKVNERIALKYIGLLSRFEKVHCIPIKAYDIVAIVSGLEPSRERLVRELVKQLRNSAYKVLIISGVVEKHFVRDEENIKLVSHLADEEFCRYVVGARYVIVRAGYSTLMDLVALGRSGIIIPTPGQTEQEYLARYLHSKKIFYAVEEKKLNIIEAIEQFEKYSDLLEDNIISLRNKSLAKKSFPEIWNL